jgi:hypothetical protein
VRSVADRRATFLWVVHRPSFLVDGNMCVGVIGEELIALAVWIDEALGFVRTLPPKQSPGPPRTAR